jgi:NAD(P)-dependent dehydrogenase (short-subunit alcohol dehydrogenase family)
MRLKGRRILITGAAAGIGLATARLFREEGASVGLLDRDAPSLSSVRQALGDGCVAEPADVSDEREVGRAVEAIAAGLGGLDGVVNSAGIDFISPLSEMTSAQWRRILAVNLDGPFHVCRAALPHLRQAGGGSIVNIASAAGLRPLDNRTAYCASKAGLVMFTKTLAIELSSDNIRSNVICPGIVQTQLFRNSYENAPDKDAELQRILDRYVIKRPGEPQEIAAAALFLTADESSFVTGAALAVDGGRSFH